MSTNRTSRTTAYQEFVFSNLPSIVRTGAGAYTYDELAAMLGLKATHNFRRRVREMVAEGLLVIVPTFSPRHNIEARFTTPTHSTTEDLPF